MPVSLMPRSCTSWKSSFVARIQLVISGNLRSSAMHFSMRLPVFFAVDEKFRLADDAVGAAQLAQQLVDV